MLTYLGLYLSFLVFFFLMPRPKGLGAFYKQLATTTIKRGVLLVLLDIL